MLSIIQIVICRWVAGTEVKRTRLFVRSSKHITRLKHFASKTLWIASYFYPLKSKCFAFWFVYSFGYLYRSWEEEHSEWLLIYCSSKLLRAIYFNHAVCSDESPCAVEETPLSFADNIIGAKRPETMHYALCTMHLIMICEPKGLDKSLFEYNLECCCSVIRSCGYFRIMAEGNIFCDCKP